MNILMLAMGNPEIGLGALMALVVIGCMVTYLAVRSATTNELNLLRAQTAELKAALDKQAEEAAEHAVAIAILERKIEYSAQRSEAIAAAAAASAPSVGRVALPPATAAPVKVEPPKQEIPDDVLVIIAAAVCAFLGKKARIRQTRLVQPFEANAWAQQGRVFVQASHNLGLSHHA